MIFFLHFPQRRGRKEDVEGDEEEEDEGDVPREGDEDIPSS